MTERKYSKEEIATFAERTNWIYAESGTWQNEAISIISQLQAQNEKLLEELRKFRSDEVMGSIDPSWANLKDN
jgi:hypothetical protein